MNTVSKDSKQGYPLENPSQGYLDGYSTSTRPELLHNRKRLEKEFFNQKSWFDALLNDDVTSMKNLLSSLHPGDYRRLLNSPVSANYSVVKKSNTWGVYLPLHISVAFCSRKASQLLVDSREATLLITDHNNCNVLHSCVIAAFYMPEVEDRICESMEWFLAQLQNDEIDRLMKQENRDGFRPLEFATQQGCLKLMNSIFQSRGYARNSTDFGITEDVVHDVTEYEVGSRQDKSPIELLTYLDGKQLEKPGTAEMILSPTFINWMDAKVRSNTIPILMCVLLRYSMIIMYFVYDSDISTIVNYYGNYSDYYICQDLSAIYLTYSLNSILLAIMAFYFGICLIFFFVDLIRHFVSGKHKFISNLSGSKTPLTNSTFYAVNHMLLAAMMATIFGMTIIMLNGGAQGNQDVLIAFNIIRGIIPVMCMWSVVYYLQMLPQTGLAIISLQGMQVDLIRFILLFIIIVIPFLFAFQTFILFNSNQGCQEDFSSVLKSFYTMFNIMLINYDIAAIPVNNKVVLQVLHIIFMFICGVMLLNFLIAVMANKASSVASHQKVFFKLNQLAAACETENRIYFATKWLYRRMRRLGYRCVDGRVYVVSRSSRIDVIKDKFDSGKK